jgi:hypothetical protein
MKATAEAFVKVWLDAHQEGHNTPWVARQLGESTQAVYERSAKLRVRGVNLPKLPRFDKQRDQHLNALIAERLGGQASDPKR